MAALWGAQQFGVIPRLVDGLWFALIGSVITVAAGTASAALRPRRDSAHRDVAR
jgi:hypothetical protein